MSPCPKCGHDPDALVTESWAFHVPRQVRSGNAHVHNVGTARFTYKRERDGWLSDVRTLARIHGVTAATGLRRVTLTRVYGKRCRAYDRDNLGTGLKPAVDALVLAGLLLGDSAKHAEIHYAQERGSVNGLRVLIEELAAHGSAQAASVQVAT